MSDQKRTDVSVIIPTIRRFEPLLDSVDDLLRQDCSPFEIVVADQNAAWPEALSHRRSALRSDARVRWLTIPPEGVVSARHSAVEASSGRVLVFVDDDVKIDDVSFIQRHLDHYADPAIDAVAGRELAPGEPRGVTSSSPGETDWSRVALTDQPHLFSRSSLHQVRVCTFSTCNGSVRRSSFLRVGGFDESFRGTSYGDDYDFAIRLAQTGGQIVYDPACALVHLRVPMGGLRLDGRARRTGEAEIALAPLIFAFRHARSSSARGLWRHLVWEGLLRKTILRRESVVRPWRQPLVWMGLLRALPAALKAASSGPTSRFSSLSDSD